MILSPSRLRFEHGEHRLSQTLVSCNSVFLSDHVIDGEVLLAGSIMLELIAEFGSMVLGTTNRHTLSDFHILRKLVIDARREIRLHGSERDGVLEVTLCSDFVRNGRVVRRGVEYARARYHPQDAVEPADLDRYFQALPGRIQVTSDEIYHPPMLTVGPFFQGIDGAVGFDSNGFWGMVPSWQPGTDFSLEPSLVDNCFQLGKIRSHIFHSSNVLPVGVDRFVFLSRPDEGPLYCRGLFEGTRRDIVTHSAIVYDRSRAIIFCAEGIHQRSAYPDNVEIPVSLTALLEESPDSRTD